ncbi:MAG TPA: hypothetical protein VG387_09165 [Rhizomicrobium sp.]|jgi:hypothetical protein|nr:hypothetical protein [Rhizomicrobium sp.]
MSTDIFDFWSKVGPDDHVHPADERVFRRLGLEGHGFNHETLPGCFMGRLRSAPVVLLFMVSRLVFGRCILGQVEELEGLACSSACR